MKSVSLMMAFYFLLGSVFPGVDFGQWGRLPDLIRHYRHHQQTEKERYSGFGSFLLDHYVQGGQHQHKDGENHQRLPLKSVQTVLSVFSSAQGTLAFFHFPNGAHLSFFYTFSLLPGISHSIFRPPVG